MRREGRVERKEERERGKTMDRGDKKCQRMSTVSNKLFALSAKNMERVDLLNPCFSSITNVLRREGRR